LNELDGVEDISGDSNLRSFPGGRNWNIQGLGVGRGCWNVTIPSDASSGLNIREMSINQMSSYLLQ